MNENEIGFIKLQNKNDDTDYFLKQNQDKTFGISMNQNEATLFTTRKYNGLKDKLDAMYFRIVNSDEYLDQGSANGIMFANKPVITTDLSTIWAWRISGNEMEAVAVADPSGIQKVCLYRGLSDAGFAGVRCLVSPLSGEENPVANVFWVTA